MVEPIRPKAGAWMEVVRIGSASLMIVTASPLWVSVNPNTDFPNFPGLLAGSYAHASPAPKPSAAIELLGKEAPDFILASLEGSQVQLSSFKGKKGVVLVFFATWCVSCMKEVPEIKQFAETARKENIEVLGVNHKQKADIVERFHKSKSINYPIILDKDGTVATEKYGIRGIPHIIGINAKGVIIYRGTDLPDKDKRTDFISNLKQGLL
jgi:peroxiredoxin